MASPFTPSSARPLSITPGSRVLQSPLSDETIWKRLKEAGFDEESIKRRDKAALIAYIAKLEAEIFDHQHHMGLFILERKEYSSKYEQIKASAEATEIKHKRDQAAHLSALAEARKREESLKKALGVEKECIASMEKALHEMRAETAETKVAAESKFAEARLMVEDAQRKFLEAEAKLHAAESSGLEASRYHSAADRKLKEVEAREDDLRRRIISFKSDCDVKEKEIILERQSLSERQKILLQEHERLLDGQASLNQREDYIFNRSEELNRLEKELDASRANIEKELSALNDEKSNLQLMVASISKREESVIEREALLNKKEQELLVTQQKLASKESVEVEKIVANQETALRTRKYEFEAELEMKRKLVEDEIETKGRALELREMDFKQREELVSEREHDLESQLRALADKEKDVAERSNYINEKEKQVSTLEKELELKNARLQKEREEINKMKLDLQNSVSSLEDKKKQVDGAKEKLEAMKTETNELSVLETKLKEELDLVRSQKLELMVEADKLKAEKAKFEAEWELIDEKREEIRKEGERVAEERQAVSKYLKDERNNIRLERDAMRDQHKHDVELLNREREEFMNKTVHERSEWFSKIEQERAEFLLGIEMQKRELENCFEKRREELENDLQDREKAFEQEKKSELQYINSLKETAEKELKLVASELKKLDAERMEINLDREQRNREWAELSNSIEELRKQVEKLKKQRELLHADREEIHAEFENLKKLEDLKVTSDIIAVGELRQASLEASRQRSLAKRFQKRHTDMQDTNSRKSKDGNGNGLSFHGMQKPDGASTPSSTRFSLLKKCRELIFKHSPEKLSKQYDRSSSKSDHEVTSIMLDGKSNLSNDGTENFLSQRQSLSCPPGEPKVILEVPPEGENVKGLCNLDPEEGLQAGRKRKNENSPSREPSLVHLQNIKKRKQQEATHVNPSQEAVTHSASSAQPNVLEDQQVLVSSNPAEKVVEESNVLIIDKIIKISEVTFEKTDAGDCIDQEKLDQLQNLVVESDQGILQCGDAHGLEDSSHAGNGVFLQESEAQGLTQEQGKYVCRDTEQNQEDATVKSDEKHEDRGVAKLVDGEKIDENIGSRTRSKVKL